MSVQPFWEPIQYSTYIVPIHWPLATNTSAIVPIVGMLCGSAISGIVMTVSYILKEIQSVWTRFIAVTALTDLL